MAEANWYVAHTYSGYENKVKADLEKTIANRHLEDQIFQVEVPLENVTEVHDGKSKEIKRKLLPGYVLVKMIMTELPDLSVPEVSRFLFQRKSLKLSVNHAARLK